MPPRGGTPRWIVAVTPKDDDVDLEAIRDHLRMVGGFSYVAIENDGSIEVSVRARNVTAAEKTIKSMLDDPMLDSKGQSRFIVGHPPP